MQALVGLLQHARKMLYFIAWLFRLQQNKRKHLFYCCIYFILLHMKLRF